jgi:serine/threonine protein phosphatase PrpC
MVHSFSYSAKSDRGLVRQNNQDAYHVSIEHGLVVVADGMGGHQAGEIASQMAIEGIKNDILQPHWQSEGDEMQTLLKLGSAVEKANLLIRAASDGRPELQGMGTTIVAAVFRLGRVFLAHVGDSRIYRIRDGKLEQMTKDHSLVQQLLDIGTFKTVKDAEAAGIGSNVLTRALGINDQVEIDLTDDFLQPGDMFLFCSDGLTNMVNDADIERLVNHYYPDLDAAVERLIVGALSSGGLDNITVVLAQPEIEETVES